MGLFILTLCKVAVGLFFAYRLIKFAWTGFRYATSGCCCGRHAEKIKKGIIKDGTWLVVGMSGIMFLSFIESHFFK
ncbi:hypothetical protein BC2926_38820 [Bacillus cereus]|nr:hypothetical protein BC2926_38820 [Bacillus cereus]